MRKAGKSGAKRVKSEIVALSVLVGMPLLGCATTHPAEQRKVSSDQVARYDEDRPQKDCGTGEVKDENGGCRVTNDIPRPFKKGGR